MFDRRLSGILLHPTSLPSPYGIGDLGNGAYNFVDFLEKADQQIWQILPLGPVGSGNSPYSSYSALAGNPLLVSLDVLYGDGLLTEEDLEEVKKVFIEAKQPENWVNYELVNKTKLPMLNKACENFKHSADEEKWQEFNDFCENHGYWLNDFCLYMALKSAHNDLPWYKWEAGIAKRNPNVLQHWQNLLGAEIFYHKFVQFIFFRQWKNLKDYANERKIKIFGDIPIYVAHDSVDVWANQEIFCLDEETGEAELMAGVPPDYFSKTGQLWGNPVYNWEKLEEDNFKWWIQRVKGMLDFVDIMRIDHFRGFEAFWAVPKGEKNAVIGEWIKAPGEKFFDLLAEELGTLPIIAEDLGIITPEVEALRDKYGFPGMKVLHFAFDSDRANPFLPFNYFNRNCVVYTGTHDNDTTVGWFEKRNFAERKRVTDFAGGICAEGIHWSLIRVALSSPANLAVFPVQDLLGLGSAAKMNTPGTVVDNWCWRYCDSALTEDISDHLAYLTYLYGRKPF
jgi:4-alpha-glucanotransferase